jgi:hypothetical protein
MAGSVEMHRCRYFQLGFCCLVADAFSFQEASRQAAHIIDNFFLNAFRSSCSPAHCT